MQFLAEVQVGGEYGIAETLVETTRRLRRGSSCLIVTPSLDRQWVRPAATLREMSADGELQVQLFREQTVE